jgi:hypothetical protein
MKISEYIEALQAIQAAEGDLEVVTHRQGQGASSIGLDFSALSAPRVGYTYSQMSGKGVSTEKRAPTESIKATGKVVFIHG